MASEQGTLGVGMYGVERDVSNVTPKQASQAKKRDDPILAWQQLSTPIQC